jgi:hypothetical protein
VTLESRSFRLLGRCAGANVVYSRAKRVFILEHYFTLKSFAAVCEAFISAYPDKEVPNKTTVHRLVTTFRDIGRVCLGQVLIERQSWNNGRTDFKQCISCNNGIRLQEFNITVGFFVLWSRDTLVSIMTDCGLDDRGSIPDICRWFSSSLCVQTGSGAHPASCTMGTGGKARPGRDADHSSPSSAEIENERSYTSSPPRRLHGV